MKVKGAPGANYQFQESLRAWWKLFLLSERSYPWLTHWSYHSSSLNHWYATQVITFVFYIDISYGCIYLHWSVLLYWQRCVMQVRRQPWQAWVNKSNESNPSRFYQSSVNMFPLVPWLPEASRYKKEILLLPATCASDLKMHIGQLYPQCKAHDLQWSVYRYNR